MFRDNTYLDERQYAVFTVGAQLREASAQEASYERHFNHTYTYDLVTVQEYVRTLTAPSTFYIHLVVEGCSHEGTRSVLTSIAVSQGSNSQIINLHHGLDRSHHASINYSNGPAGVLPGRVRTENNCSRYSYPTKSTVTLTGHRVLRGWNFCLLFTSLCSN